MWPTINRARRRLGGAVAPAEPGHPPIEPGQTLSPAVDAGIEPPAGREDAVIVLTGPEMGRLRQALQRRPASGPERPDTPARLEEALVCLLVDRRDPGAARVVRLPAGLTTPESWQVRLDGVDPESAQAIRDAARTGWFEP